MDWDAVVQGISRDLVELSTGGPIGWALLGLVFAFPVVLVVVARRTRLAWFAFAVWLVPLVVWAVYYGLPLPNAGVEGGIRMSLLFLVAWLVLGAAASRGRRGRRRAARDAGDVAEGARA